MDADGNISTQYTFLNDDSPTSLVQAADGNFYGTTAQGGAATMGTVFEMTSGGAVTTLHEFSGGDGSTPLAALLEVAGSFYGTTRLGGTENEGTVFRIDASGAFSTLHSFQPSLNDGVEPLGGLVQGVGGLLYGTTSGGGNFSSGVVYSLTPRTSTTLSAASVTGTYGGTITLSATLVSGSGPMSGRSVMFSLQAQPLGSALTDINGLATLNNVSLVGLNAGTYSSAISAAFAGDDALAATSSTADLDIIQATPVITWPVPAPITYGTPLSAVQLNATASVPGTFVYTPAAGTVLAAGTQMLAVTFTPSDTTELHARLQRPCFCQWRPLRR